MKKLLLTCTLFALFIVNLFVTIPAHAYYSGGWNLYYKDGDRSAWSYRYEDGNLAKGWQFIDGDWYYFIPTDYSYATLSGTAYRDQYGAWQNLDSSVFEIDNQFYFFDNQGRLIRNVDVFINGTYHYIDKDGHVQS